MRFFCIALLLAFFSPGEASSQQPRIAPPNSQPTEGLEPKLQEIAKLLSYGSPSDVERAIHDFATLMEDNKPRVGRFQVTMGEGGKTVLLDTTTGRTWLMVVDGKTNEFIWSFVPFSMTDAVLGPPVVTHLRGAVSP